MISRIDPPLPRYTPYITFWASGFDQHSRTASTLEKKTQSNSFFPYMEINRLDISGETDSGVISIIAVEEADFVKTTLKDAKD